MTAPAPVSGRAVGRLYGGLWTVLVEWFRVPGEPPTLPEPGGEAGRSGGAAPGAFQPDHGFLRYLRFWFWLAAAVSAVVIGVLWIVLLVAKWWLAIMLLPVALALAAAPLTVAWVALHLRYDTTWYVMTDRSLRIRRGVWLIHEMTITFENVQNVLVRQGPVQRLLGISDIVVETAGGGSERAGKSRGVGNRGVIEGVADAAGLRDVILARLRSSHSAGLGDEDGAPAAGDGGWTSEHVDVLREIRDLV